MIVYNILRVLGHIVIGLWTCAFVFPLTDAAGREWRIKHWSIKLLAICGVEIEINNAAGGRIADHALIVSNHVSWLDVFVINSLRPCRFVAKADIRDWPLLGWLCERSGTIFIARGKRRDVRRIYEDLVASLRNGERVAFFPEGTTAAQGGLLTFHANLLQAAIDAGVPIQPYALRYSDHKGDYHLAADFTGEMTFAQSAITILKSRKISAELTILPIIETADMHRRELARRTQNAIAASLSHPDGLARSA